MEKGLGAFFVGRDVREEIMLHFAAWSVVVRGEREVAIVDLQEALRELLDW